jgi:hypothetical protein
MLLATLAAPLTVLLLTAGKSGTVSKRNDLLPPSGIVYGESDLSRISFSCYFVDGRTDTIKCDFLQVFVTMPFADEVTRKLAEADQQFEADWKEESKKPLRELKKLCDPKERQLRDGETRRLQSNAYIAALRPGLESGLRFYDRLCSCTDKTCVHDANKAGRHEYVQEDAESCTIKTITWTSNFRRSGEAWVSVDTVERALFHCYSSVTTTLSQAKEGVDLGFGYWSMRTVKVPNPNADPKFCTKTLQDSTDSFEGYGVIALTCKSLKL